MISDYFLPKWTIMRIQSSSRSPCESETDEAADTQVCCVAVLGTAPTSKDRPLLTRAGKTLRVTTGTEVFPSYSLPPSLSELSPQPAPSTPPPTSQNRQSPSASTASCVCGHVSELGVSLFSLSTPAPPQSVHTSVWLPRVPLVFPALLKRSRLFKGIV